MSHKLVPSYLQAGVAARAITNSDHFQEFSQPIDCEKRPGCRVSGAGPFQPSIEKEEIIMKLQIVRTTLQQPSPAPAVHPRQPGRYAAVTAENAAKGHRSIDERAEMAARWHLGELALVKPTRRLAAAAFHVPPVKVNAAVNSLRGEDPPKDPMLPINVLWQTMTAAERDTFVRSFGNQIMRVIDRLTS